jgi:prepilin-type N-terminal cleavage/methylation domain-containing protein
MSCIRGLESNKGFTLIEIVTVIVVLGILSVFTFSFIDNAVKTYMIGSKQRMLYQEASYIVERIARELRDAQSVSRDSSGQTLTITKASHASNPLIMDESLNVVFYRDAGSRRIMRRSISASGVVFSDTTMGNNVDTFDVPTGSGALCSSTTPNCMVNISLTLSDSSIPIDDAIAKSVKMVTAVSPKNIQPSTNQYMGRCFNGDYEDVVQ